MHTQISINDAHTLQSHVNQSDERVMMLWHSWQHCHCGSMYNSNVLVSTLLQSEKWSMIKYFFRYTATTTSTKNDICISNGTSVVQNRESGHGNWIETPFFYRINSWWISVNVSNRAFYKKQILFHSNSWLYSDSGSSSTLTKKKTNHTKRLANHFSTPIRRCIPYTDRFISLVLLFI